MCWQHAPATAELDLTELRSAFGGPSLEQIGCPGRLNTDGSPCLPVQFTPSVHYTHIKMAAIMKSAVRSSVRPTVSGRVSSARAHAEFSDSLRPLAPALVQILPPSGARMPVCSPLASQLKDRACREFASPCRKFLASLLLTPCLPAPLLTVRPRGAPRCHRVVRPRPPEVPG